LFLWQPLLSRQPLVVYCGDHWNPWEIYQPWMNKTKSLFDTQRLAGSETLFLSGAPRELDILWNHFGSGKYLLYVDFTAQLIRPL
jgi:hypothetical protein